MNYMDKIKASIDFISSKTKFSPKVGLILGSGLGSLAEKINNPTIIKYEDILGFPNPLLKDMLAN